MRGDDGHSIPDTGQERDVPYIIGSAFCYGPSSTQYSFRSADIVTRARQY